MFRAVCLDFDGTLAEYQGDFDVLLDTLRTDLGLLACDFTTFRRRLSTELRRDGPLTLESALVATLEDLEQRAPTDLREVVDRAVANYSDGVELLPCAADLLVDLESRGVPLALLTNGPSDMQRAAVRKLDLVDRFAAVLVSGDDDVGVRKPGQRIFELACWRLGTNAAEALMIGDDLEKDVEGARAAGMMALHVTGDLAPVRDWLTAESRHRPA